MINSPISNEGDSESAKAANEILAGRSADLQEILEVAKNLRMEKKFVWARKLLAGRARNILRGQSLEPATMLKLAKELKTVNEFGLARRLLARARLEPSLSDDQKLR